MEKDLKKFFQDFNTPDGYGQFNKEEAEEFNRYFKNIPITLGKILAVLREKPNNLAKKSSFTSFSYLAKLFRAKISHIHRQELLRWKSFLKSLEAKILVYKRQYPSVVDQITPLFSEIFNALNALMSILEEKEQEA
jgi:hypothetical protein